MKKLFTLIAFAQFLISTGQSVEGPLPDSRLYEKSNHSSQTTKILAKKIDQGWFDWFYVLDLNGANLERFKVSLFPDSNMLVTYYDTSNNKYLGSIKDHSVGMINDPRSMYFGGQPFQTSKFVTYRVDSVGFPYIYKRWNQDTSVRDTLLIQIYPSSAMLTYASQVVFDLPYNYLQNKGSGSTIELVIPLDVSDTTGSDFAFMTVPVGMNVNWSNNGNNRFGVTMSYIPGQKDYSSPTHLDTLAAGDWYPAKRYNQFQIEMVHDYDMTTESALTDPTGFKVANNGLTAHTPIRYNNAGGLNGRYYAGSWIDNLGKEYYRFPRLIWSGTANVGIKEINKDGYGIGDAYPNPVYGTSFSIDIQLPKSEKVSISIYDLTGKKLQEMTAGVFNAGINSIEINTEELKPGVYFYRVEAGVFVGTGKVMLLN